MWSKEQFQAWKGNPETRAFLTFLSERRDELMQQWADGQQMTAHQTAMSQVFGDIMRFEYDRDIAPYYEKQENG